MTQPPDDRVRPPNEPIEPAPDGEQADSTEAPVEPTPAEGEVAAPDAPTVAWTPPDAASQQPPPSPIISADTSGGPPPPTTWQPPGTPPPAPPITGSGWQTPAVPPPPVPASGGGWEIPTTPAPVAAQSGYVVGGVGARFVAWLIDGLLAGLIPGAVFLFVVDWSSMFREVFSQIQFDQSGRVIPNYGYNFTFPMTADLILAYLILVGVQFLYFVGFWTSRWGATPGMIGLKMRVVDANTGAPLTVLQAVRRWFAMGWWISLLLLIPVLQYAVGLAQFAVNVFLFLSTAMDDRRRGFHDKFAGSQVIRAATSGGGATLIGCLVYIVMAILLSIVVAIVVFSAMAPELQRIFDQYPRNTA